ncbi:uncharacterized protein (DUF2235 family) [Sphingomonas sp. BK580]|nr:uncharacterized protein (DUF2235 family) [Sphingomonas sp. BK580]
MAPQLRVRFLGVWDTVGALGVPEKLPFSGWFNREYDFHDPSLDAFVESARHAVAIDERRELFPVVSFGDLTQLNRSAGVEPDHPDAPYQEKWFPGVHGAIGGGGDIRGLSDDALVWVLAGASKAGLKLDTANGTRIHGFKPDALAPLANESKPEWSATQLLRDDRDGPRHVWQVAQAAQRRWRTPAHRLGGEPYRPDTLKHVAAELNAMGMWTFEPPADVLAVELVKPSDTLSHYAHRHYGDASLWRTIFKANIDTLDDPDEIFPGQEIRIPRLPEATASGDIGRAGG